jgi:hypothetical protein
LKQTNLNATAATDGGPRRFLVVDRRKSSGGLRGSMVAASRDFALVPAAMSDVVRP